MAEPGRPSPGWRAAFAGTLAVTMGIGPFAVNAVGALSPLIVPDLGLSRTELGSLATVTFAVAAATSVVGGRQVDAVPTRSTATAVFVVGGAAAAVVAGAPSLLWLWAGAALGGVTQAVANPVTNQLVSENVPAGRQGLLVGIKQSGVQMMQALIGFALPPLALLAGWRGSMLVGVAFAVLGITAVRLVLPAADAPRVANPGAGRGRVDAAVWWLAAYTFVIGTTVQAVIIFVPLYAFERAGLPPAVAGMTAGVLGVTGVAARIGWSRAAERLAAPVRTLTVLASVAFASVLAVAAGEQLAAWLLWPGLVGFGASALAVNAVVMLTVVRRAAGGPTGRASGVVGLGLYGGFMVGPLGFGPLVDRTDSYLLGWAVVAGMCLVAVALTVVWRRAVPAGAGSAAAGGTGS